MLKITVYGSASQTIVKTIGIAESDLDKTVLSLLQESAIPVASSCQGEGVCKKCVINESTLSCMLLVREILKWEKPFISISYL